MEKTDGNNVTPDASDRLGRPVTSKPPSKSHSEGGKLDLLGDSKVAQLEQKVDQLELELECFRGVAANLTEATQLMMHEIVLLRAERRTLQWLYFSGQILYKDFTLKEHYYDKEKEFLFA